MIGQLEEKELLVSLQTLEMQAKENAILFPFENLLQNLNQFKEKLVTSHIA